MLLVSLLWASGLVQPHVRPAFRRTVPPTAVASAPVKCDVLLRELFDGRVDAAAVAAACSETVEWNDMDLKESIRGRAAVRTLLEDKFPAGSKLVVERMSDGAESGGFTWHREADDVEGTGLRGITYVELDETGQIAYVQEGAEPLFKLDKILEAVLQATNKAAKEGDGAAQKPPPSYTKQRPTTATGIAKYLWEVAYPGGATPGEALEFFADDIRYEDFNYYEPFVGLGPVSEYIGLLEVFPDFVFISERISEGERGCCITWRCEVNGEDGPSGISYNEVDADGKICFARDIPAPSLKPPPVAALAKLTSPKLRVLTPRPALGAAGAPAATVAAVAEAAPEATYPSAFETVTSSPVRPPAPPAPALSTLPSLHSSSHRLPHPHLHCCPLLRPAPAPAPPPPLTSPTLTAPATSSLIHPLPPNPPPRTQVRLAILLTYLAFNVYVVGFSPGEFSTSLQSPDMQIIAKAFEDPSTLNAIFFVAFNALGVLPAVNLALLLPGSKGQSPLPTAPFIGASFAFGFGAAGPYLALRQPRPEPIARSQLGFFSRYVTESKVRALVAPPSRPPIALARVLTEAVRTHIEL